MPRKRDRIMKVAIDFQPNRMEDEALSAAYELILPMERKGVRSAAARNAIKKNVEQPMQLAIFSSVAI